MIPDRNIYDAISDAGPQGGALANESRALNVWAIEIIKDRFGLYATPEQMVNAAFLVREFVLGHPMPLVQATWVIDKTKLPIPAAGLPSASYPPPAATP